MNRPINPLYLLETVSINGDLNNDPLPPEKIQQKENDVNVKQVTEILKPQAAIITLEKLKEMFSDKIGTFVCC